MLLLFILIQNSGLGQSQELFFLKGRIVCPAKEFPEVNVFNLRSESSTVTNQNGEYTLFAKVGDTLKFTGLQIETKTQIIEQEDVKKSLFVTSLTPKVIALDEVTIKEYKNINAVSLGILDKPAKNIHQPKEN
ncbi:hypothetical protein [Flavobacterium phycosphaerae]|uniref:hypothetical protein n=1 Tax=Flavobacterium phycosphaerae TaxID=2697515 RepID=UPI00138A6A85|nr:hypothetical protein [Flavobacterium phycosphaerae]